MVISRDEFNKLAENESLVGELEDEIYEATKKSYEEGEAAGWKEAVERLDTYISELFTDDPEELQNAIKALDKVHVQILEECK
jgi:FMN-dependent NADH-azoreductase